VTVKNKNRARISDMKGLMETLPYQLRIKIGMEIHKALYENIRFFTRHGESYAFVDWAGN
jgi:hypothetical protein